MKLGTSQTPVLAEVLREAMEHRLSEVFTSLPGSVTKYNPTTQEVDVQPNLKIAYVNDDGTEGTDALPIVPAVPVLFPRAGKFFITFPIQKGDPVLLVCAQRSLDEWSASSGKVQIDPIDLRMHDLSDAVAIPGCYTDPKALTDTINSGMALGKEKGVQIRITDSATVEITTKGATASVGGFVALADYVEAQLTTLKNVIAGAAVLAGDGGAVFKANIGTALSAWPGSTASTNLKAD